MEQQQFQQLVDSLLEQTLKQDAKQRLKKKPSTKVGENSFQIQPKKDPHPCVDCGEIITHRTINYTVNYKDYKNTKPYWQKSCDLCGKKLDYTK